MSPFGYLPPEPTGTALEQKEQQATADILAREVTPAPTTGVLPVFWCIECGVHHADSPTKPCPVCAPPPPKFATGGVVGPQPSGDDIPALLIGCGYPISYNPGGQA